MGGKTGGEHGVFSWRNPWSRWSVLALTATTAAALLVGFVWLPSAQRDFAAQGLWASICRAAGVPQAWGATPVAGPLAGGSTRVVLDQAMARPASGEAAGRGATIALQRCSMCHGAAGIGTGNGNAPSLAGQHAEVVVKQLTDYQRGDRSHSLMQAMAANLSERDMGDLAAHYAGLNKPRVVPSAGGGSVPALVQVGDPMRNIAPCASCHGGLAHKLGAPWLEGLPTDYLSAQLIAFANGTRRNDSHAQMRNMARQLSPGEITELSSFYGQR